MARHSLVHAGPLFRKTGSFAGNDSHLVLPLMPLRGQKQVRVSRQSCVHAATVESPPRQEAFREHSVVDTHPTEAARASAFTTELPQQQAAPFELRVEGKVPKWLSGSIVRNGPGFYAPQMQHMFDGYGLLVKFIFKDGKVQTMQRCVESTAYKSFVRTGQMPFNEFGTVLPFTQSILNIAKTFLHIGQGETDNACVNTHTCRDGQTLVAMSEPVKAAFEVDLGSLGTVRRVDHGSDNLEATLTTAHPVVDDDGTLYNIYLEIGKSRWVAKVDPKTLQRTVLAEVPMDNPTSPPWIHDLPASKNYVIVPDTPVLYDLKAIVLGKGDYVIFKWDPAAQSTKFHLVSKRDGSVRTVRATFNFMTFHYTNAFESEDGNEIYLDTTAYKDPEHLNLLKLDNLRHLKEDASKATGPFSRITIPLDGRPAAIRTLIPGEEDYIFAELARINPHNKQKAYRYAYALNVQKPASFGNALMKMDNERGSYKQWHEPGCIPTEALMIPRPGAVKEDDGVVTSLVTGTDGNSFLLVLDAGSFEELARAHLPYGVAYGFHNQFIPA